MPACQDGFVCVGQIFALKILNYLGQNISCAIKTRGYRMSFIHFRNRANLATSFLEGFRANHLLELRKTFDCFDVGRDNGSVGKLRHRPQYDNRHYFHFDYH